MTLNERVRNIQHGATLIGDITERIVTRLLKASASTFEAEELAPDIDTTWGHVECKAFKSSTRCLLHKRQIENYQKLGTTVWYAFISYTHPGPVPKRARKIEVIENVLSTIEAVFILDIRLVLKGLELAGNVKGFGNRHAKLYFYGREPIERDYLTLSLSGVKHLAETAPAAWKNTVFKRQINFTYEDAPLKTRLFDVVKCVEPVPF